MSERSKKVTYKIVKIKKVKLELLNIGQKKKITTISSSFLKLEMCEKTHDKVMKIFLFAKNLVVIIFFEFSSLKPKHNILHSQSKSYTIYSIESEILLHRLLTFIEGNLLL